MLDKSFQDVQFGADFKCADGCKTGVLLRAEKTAGRGMKGMFVSLEGTSATSYAVTLDANGKELTREPLAAAAAWLGSRGRAGRASGGRPRRSGRGGAPAGGGGDPAAPRAAGVVSGRVAAPALRRCYPRRVRPGGALGGPRGGGGRGPSAVTSIVPHPSNALKPNDWNDVDVIVDARSCGRR